MKEQILEALREYPTGLRKREIASYTGIWVGHLVKPIAELEKKGKIQRHSYSDIGNFERYDIYTIKKGQ